MKPMLPILLLMLFSCSNNKPVLISNLVTRGGLVYEHTYYSIFNGEGVNIAARLEALAQPNVGLDPAKRGPCSSQR